MSTYDPIPDEEGETVTPTTLARQFNCAVEDRDAAEDAPGFAGVQLRLAVALDAIGPQVFDDCAKWAAVQSIIEAMDALDRIGNTKTVIRRDDEAVSVDVNRM